MLLTNCNNYGLLDKLENPGQSTAGLGQRNLRIFVTAAGYNGNLGGIAGADAKCVADAANPMGPGNGFWKALIVGTGRAACTTANCSVGGNGENFDWALKPNTNYIRPNGLVIGSTNPFGIFTFPLNSPIGDQAMTFAWTGLLADWTISGSNTCADWSSTGSTGIRGQVDINTSTVIQASPQTCGVSERLYCVEQ
ncbi:MAG: hypothetical protein OHK0011_15380 [Turneriella sp.]